MTLIKQSTCKNCGRIIKKVSLSSIWTHHEDRYRVEESAFSFCDNVGKDKYSTVARENGNPWVTEGLTADPGKNSVVETDHIIKDVLLPVNSDLDNASIELINDGNIIYVKNSVIVPTLIEAVHREVIRNPSSSYIVMMKTSYLAKKFDVEYALEYPDDTKYDITVSNEDKIPIITLGRHFDFVYVYGWGHLDYETRWQLDRTTLKAIRGII